MALSCEIMDIAQLPPDVKSSFQDWVIQFMWPYQKI